MQQPSTNRRRPWSVGSRPAEVCGANRRPASVRSAITLRMVAGDRFIGSRRDKTADRFSGLDILFDDFAQDGGRAGIQARRQNARKP